MQAGGQTTETYVLSEGQSVRQLLVRLLKDDAGQDLIEYGLLAALIGTVGIFAWQNIQSQIGIHYSGWDTNAQDLSSCTPDPGTTGC